MYFVFRLLPLIAVALLALAAEIRAEPPLLFAHYMPWFATEATSGKWGWHWTMGRVNPDEMNWEGERQSASHQRPLIGLYDSSDPDLLECHALLMKFSGFDGAIIDWYGTADVHDYAANARNTEKFIAALKRAGLRYAICYEDQSLREVLKRPQATDPLPQARRDLEWLEQHVFADEACLRLDGRPVLLTFGPQVLSAGQWRTLREGRTAHPLLFGLPHLATEAGCDGAFGWPPVSGGRHLAPIEWKREIESLYARQSSGVPVIATAFPGFQDYYKEAGLHDSYGQIDGRDGATLTESLDWALTSGARIVQVATWNDFGEGTMVEPTRNQGFRKLEAIQRRAPALQRSARRFTSADLRLPVQLYRLRKQAGGDAALKALLDRISDALHAGRCDEAEPMLVQAGEIAAAMPAFLFESEETPDTGYRIAQDILYRTEGPLTDGMRQRCRLDVYSPADATGFATVVWFHGGGIRAGERSLPLRLRRQGVAVVSANYRLSPEVKCPAYLEDAAAAVAWTFRHITRYGGSTNAIFVSGHSAGAYLAAEVGLDRRWLAPHGVNPDRIAGLIPLSPQVITHFTVRAEQGIDEKQPVIDTFAPLYHVRKDAPPILVMTGDREKELNGRYEECAYFWRMLKVVGHPDCTIEEMKGADHGGMPEPAFPRLLDFVKARVPKAAP